MDIDLLFQQRYATTAAAYIRSHGEDAFRACEYEVLQSALKVGATDAVISTGGGIVTYPDSRKLLCACETVVWLRVQPTTVLQRAEQDAVDRPLLQANGINPLEHVNQLLGRRNPLYAECANVIVDVDGREPDELVEWIQTRLQQH